MEESPQSSRCGDILRPSPSSKIRSGSTKETELLEHKSESVNLEARVVYRSRNIRVESIVSVGENSV